MTYLEAMNMASTNSVRVTRRAPGWKDGSYVRYNTGLFGGYEKNGTYSMAFHSPPRYEMINGKKITEYRPTMADLVCDDWFVLEQRKQGGDNNGKRK